MTHQMQSIPQEGHHQWVLPESPPMPPKKGRQWRMNPIEKALSSQWFVGAMCICLVVGIILASITSSQSVAHALGTTIPKAVGGSLIGIALIGLLAHKRTQNEINWRTDESFVAIGPPLTPEEIQQAVKQGMIEAKRNCQEADDALKKYDNLIL